MVKLPPIPPIAELLKLYGINAKKKLGQNFLMRKATVYKLGTIVGPRSNLAKSLIFEIGPGPTSLTRGLLKAGAKSIVAIEKDSTFLPLLQQLKESCDGRFDYFLGDAVEDDPRQVYEKTMTLAKAKEPFETIHLVGNLPFSITGQLMFQLFDQAASRSGFFMHDDVEMTFMFQLEVAEKLASIAESKERGKLSILTQALFEAWIVAFIPSNEFFPPPKVESAMVKFKRLPNAVDYDTYQNLKLLCDLIFMKKRKKIITSLKHLPEIESHLDAVSIRPLDRVHQIPTKTLIQLAKRLNLKNRV